MSSNVAIGIDLGTTSSCVAVNHNGKIKIISNPEGFKRTPSEVAFRERERLVGNTAQRQGGSNPKNSIFNIKRLIGKRSHYPELVSDVGSYPFRVLSKDANPVVEVKFKGEHKAFTPEELTAMILQKMKDTAERYLGHEVSQALITIPANFNQSQRRATRDAAVIAGFTRFRFFHEPTAAALTYCLENTISEEKRLLIFDLGGGTFDVSVVKVCPDSVIEVIATAGDTNLGGSDFDRKLLDFFANEFKRKNDVDITENPRSMRRLRAACEVVKRNLSTSVEATIEVDSLFETINFLSKITQVKFEELCADLFDRILEPVKKALEDAKMNRSDIDEIVLVGGSTRMPKIQQILSEFFNGKTLNHSINPDEAVALGAAAQAAIFAKMESDAERQFVIRDVTPLSFGFEGPEGFMRYMYYRNTRIPFKKVDNFCTSSDNQPCFIFSLYEGEGFYAKQNYEVSRCFIEGFPPLPRGEAKIYLELDVDADGIITITASEGSTGEAMQVQVYDGRLNKTDISRMTDEVGSYEKEQKLYREQAVARDKLEEYAYKIQDFVAEDSIYLPPQDSEKLRYASKGEVSWLDDNKEADTETLESRFNALKGICDPIISKEEISRKQSIEQERAESRKKLSHYLNEISLAIKAFSTEVPEEQCEFLSQHRKRAMEWLNENKGAAKKTMDTKLEDLKRVCEPIIVELQDLKARVIEQRRVELKNKLKECLNEIWQVVKTDGILTATKRNELNELFRSGSKWLENNESASEQRINGKYQEIDKTCRPIINYFNKLKIKHFQELNESRNKLGRYLNEVGLKLVRNSESFSTIDQQKIRAMLQQQVIWFAKNKNVTEKDEFDSRYIIIKQVCGEIIKKWEDEQKRDAEKKRINSKNELQNYLEKIKNILEIDGKKFSPENFELLRNTLHQELSWLEKNAGAPKEHFDLVYQKTFWVCEDIIAGLVSIEKKNKKRRAESKTRLRERGHSNQSKQNISDVDLKKMKISQETMVERNEDDDVQVIDYKTEKCAQVTTEPELPKKRNERVEAKEELEGYIAKIRKIIEEDRAYLTDVSYKLIQQELEREVEWLKRFGNSGKDKYITKHAEMKKVCDPAITRMESMKRRKIEERRVAASVKLDGFLKEIKRQINHNKTTGRNMAIVEKQWQQEFDWLKRNQDADEERFNSKYEEIEKRYNKAVREMNSSTRNNSWCSIS